PGDCVQSWITTAVALSTGVAAVASTCVNVSQSKLPLWETSGQDQCLPRCLRHRVSTQPGVNSPLYHRRGFFPAVALFQPVEIARGESELLRGLELGKTERFAVAFQSLTETGRPRQRWARRRFVPSQALVGRTDTLRWFNQDGRLEPVRRPAAARDE